jgi:hypothetical protein
VLASHELDRTEALADRAIHLVGGRVDDRSDAASTELPVDQGAGTAEPLPEPPAAATAAAPSLPAVGVPC